MTGDGPPQGPAGTPPNPFAVPRLFVETDPLNPLRHEEHLDYYVAVDHTEESFQDFQKRFQDVADLLHEGRLVLVSGEKGCGKTTLINRCAHWLRGRIEADRQDVEVVDLTREAQDTDTIPVRRSTVSRALVDNLHALTLLKSDLVYETRDDADSTYRNLPTCLAASQWLIVLLPRAELAEELRYYAVRAPKRMVFFAETTPEVGTQHAPGRTIRLQVDAFEHEHATLFATDRLRRLPTGTLPPLAATALDEFLQDNRKTTIGEIQQLLFGVYETLRVQDNRPDEVTWNHLARHFISVSRRLREQP